MFQIVSAWFLPVLDCDEVFNYWEPLHYLQYGNGSQVWEYSPIYALRSYLFLFLHYIPAYPLTLLPKIYVFKSLRVILALFSIFCQKKMIKTLELPNTAYILFNIAPGMLIASHSFLPSTFAMNFSMLALTYFHVFSKSQNYLYLFYSLLSCSIAMVIGWPFVAVLFAAFTIPYLIKLPGFLLNPKLYLLGILALLVTTIPSFFLDSYYYGKPVLSVANVLIYNTSLGKNLVGSSLLFGIDPWHMYLSNLFLNFNFVNKYLDFFHLPSVSVLCTYCYADICKKLDFIFICMAGHDDLAVADVFATS